jgi:hypothetical protein
MCELKQNLRMELLDAREVPKGQLEAVVKAAFDAQDTVCCSKRRNAMSLAVVEKAREFGLSVAWGDILDAEAPDYYLWPTDTWRTSFLRDYLEEKRALRIDGASVQSMRASLAS